MDPGSHDSAAHILEERNRSTSCATKPGFISHPYLDRLHLKINKEFHFLACQLCQEAIPTKETRKHLINKHAELSLIFDQTCFDSVVEDLAIVLKLPTDISGPRNPVYGLAVHTGIACERCSSVFIKKGTMQNHHRDTHKDIAMPTSWRGCKAQCLKPKGTGSYQTFWEILVDEERSERSSRVIMVEKVMKELEKELDTVQVSNNGQLVSPWLLTTRWHEYVAAFDTPTKEICGRVALPQLDKEDEEDF